jgi:hypothetical protein
VHERELECIRQGLCPCKLGCKVPIATSATASKGGQFVLHAKALHGNPYDGCTHGPVILDLEKLTGAAVRRIQPLKAKIGLLPERAPNDRRHVAIDREDVRPIRPAVPIRMARAITISKPDPPAIMCVAKERC